MKNQTPEVTTPSQADINRMIDLTVKGVGVEQIRLITGIPANEQGSIFQNYRLNSKRYLLKHTFNS